MSESNTRRLWAYLTVKQLLDKEYLCQVSHRINFQTETLSDLKQLLIRTCLYKEIFHAVSNIMNPGYS